MGTVFARDDASKASNDERAAMLENLCRAVVPELVERIKRGETPESLQALVVHRSSVCARDLFEAPRAPEVVARVMTRTEALHWALQHSRAYYDRMARLPSRAGEVVCVVMFDVHERIVSISIDPIASMVGR